ncbi:hypothetical protein [Pseudomonas koreensis]|uniref:hypothetical protein n=1 Tax=Pseudomonas koreensis TaxID=198620 RepID=UPI003F86FD19
MFFFFAVKDHKSNRNKSVPFFKGCMGVGPDGAAELVGPLKKLLEYTQLKGGQTVTFSGYFASEEGAPLGGGEVGEKFSYSFPATKEGLREPMHAICFLHRTLAKALPSIHSVWSKKRTDYV